jgi:hypothetical protein
MSYRHTYLAAFAAVIIFAASSVAQTGTSFKIGEKLSYTLALGNIQNGGYAEMFVASRGKIGGRDAIEIRSRIKTIGVLSAAFVLLDQGRTVFVDPATGMPLYIKRTENSGPIPRETAESFLKVPATNFDIITLLYQVRASGGNGTYTFSEGDRVYTATFRAKGNDHIKTDAGNFDTTTVSVQSEFLTAHGLRDMKIDLSTDDDHVPVVIRFRTQKNFVEATLSAIANDAPVETASVDPTARPTPVPERTPIPIPTPRSTPTARPYVANEPLLTELGFDLGEKLNYRVTAGGQMLATVVMEAVERKEFERKDSLLLTATVTGVERPNGLFRPGDHVRAQVDPETLAPRWVEGKLGPGLSILDQTLVFDPRTGVTFGGAKPAEAPVGTHTLLSLLYAMRSFNLQHSRDDNNPINDTRVAVFFGDKPYVFTLRPVPAADITVNGRKYSAQLVNITTQNPQLDALNLKVWLDADSRVPLRISAGQYQADLITE